MDDCNTAKVLSLVFQLFFVVLFFLASTTHGNPFSYTLRSASPVNTFLVSKSLLRSYSLLSGFHEGHIDFFTAESPQTSITEMGLALSSRLAHPYFGNAPNLRLVNGGQRLCICNIMSLTKSAWCPFQIMTIMWSRNPHMHVVQSKHAIEDDSQCEGH